MSKKNFKDSPALAFIKPQSHAHEAKQEGAQNDAHENLHEKTYDDAYNHVHEDASVREGYVRTQGRKGYKKPRINLAFDSVAFLDKIREYAEIEGKSITQFVNDSVACYIERKSKEGTRRGEK